MVLGANAGTTVTAMLASLATGSTAALSVALVHLFFNIYGIIAIYPFRQIPISMAKTLARLSLRSRWVAVGYVLVVFFALPLTLILLTK